MGKKRLPNKESSNLNHKPSDHIYIWLSFTSYEFTSKSKLLLCVYIVLYTLLHLKSKTTTAKKNQMVFTSVVNSKLACLILYKYIPYTEDMSFSLDICFYFKTRQFIEFFFSLDNSQMWTNQIVCAKKNQLPKLFLIW